MQLLVVQRSDLDTCVTCQHTRGNHLNRTDSCLEEDECGCEEFKASAAFRTCAFTLQSHHWGTREIKIGRSGSGKLLIRKETRCRNCNEYP